MIVYLILALIWVFAAWLYFLLKERRNVVIESTQTVPETKTNNNLRVKVDFTFSDSSDKDLLKADLVLKLNDLINGSYKIPDEFQKKVLGQAQYKEKKRKKTVRKKKDSQPEILSNPDTSQIDSIKSQPVDDLDDFIAATSAEQESKENDTPDNSDGLSGFESLI